MARDTGVASRQQWFLRVVSTQATHTAQPAGRRPHLRLVTPQPPFIPEQILHRRVMDSSPGLDDIPPPPVSTRRAITPLRPITLPEGRGRVSSVRGMAQASLVPAQESIQSFLFPMAVALLCGAFFWLLTVAKSIPW
jgi:hypothetical protein